MSDSQSLTEKKPRGTWVQTERAAHEAWAGLMRESPNAAMLMHLLVARVGDHNAVVASQKVLAGLMGRHVNTVKNALKVLKDKNWIEVRQIGDRGTVNAYIVNDRIAWTGPRDGIRYSLFSAQVLLSDEEQPDAAQLDHQEPLRRVPSLLTGERQLPSGEGLPPQSQPFFDGLEPDMPATRQREDE
jgi:hypothetical protein